MNRPFSQRVSYDRRAIAAPVVAPLCLCGHPRFDHEIGEAVGVCTHVINGREYCACDRYAEAAADKAGV